MAYGDFKDLAKRTASDKVLRDKAFNIAKNPRYDGYQRGIASMIYKFFGKKSALLSHKSVSGSGVNTHANNKTKENQRPLDLATHQLAEELRKLITKEFKKRLVYSRSQDNIWGDDLGNMHLISKFNKGFRLLLCTSDNFSKYAWVVLLTDKKGVSIADAFQKILD